MKISEEHPDIVIGFEDETWWSRFKQPNMHAYCDEKALRLVEKTKPKDDPDPKAFACYGLLLSLTNDEKKTIWLRFVDGQPNGEFTIQFLSWSLEKLQRLGKKGLILIWDHATWHKSNKVQKWVKKYNQNVKKNQNGVRLIPWLLPKKSPWLNRIEPYWGHAKRCVNEHENIISAVQLAKRVCRYFKCDLLKHLSINQNVA